MDDARSLLVSAALDLMAEGGAAGVSVAAASRAAGVSRRTAYNHFADRAALIRAARKRLEQRLLEATRGATDANAFQLVGETAAEGEAFLRSQIHDALEQGAARNKTLRAIVAQFRDLERAGRLKPGTDAEMAAMISFGSWLGAVLAVSLAGSKRKKGEIAERFAHELERSMQFGVFEEPTSNASEEKDGRRRDDSRKVG